jgi:hypothetical protein
LIYGNKGDKYHNIKEIIKMAKNAIKNIEYVKKITGETFFSDQI